MDSALDQELQVVWDLLNRGSKIDVLLALNHALDPLKNDAGDTSTILFGFDTNTLLRVGQGRSGSEAVDYLGRQRGRLVIPGQTLQELWNNHIVAASPEVQSEKARIDQAIGRIEAAGYDFGREGEELSESFRALMAVHGEILSGAAFAALRVTIETFAEVAVVPFVPRREFAELAEIRHSTKTPPGFKDSGYGDFFVWADFLYGLKMSDLSGVGKIVFVGQDRKPDWMRGGTPHPILTAEVSAMAQLPFEIWDLARLQEHITRMTR